MPVAIDVHSVVLVHQVRVLQVPGDFDVVLRAAAAHPAGLVPPDNAALLRVSAIVAVLAGAVVVVVIVVVGHIAVPSRRACALVPVLAPVDDQGVTVYAYVVVFPVDVRCQEFAPPRSWRVQQERALGPAVMLVRAGVPEERIHGLVCVAVPVVLVPLVGADKHSTSQ